VRPTRSRPDVDAQWLSLPVNFFVWNMLLLLRFSRVCAPSSPRKRARGDTRCGRPCSYWVTGWWAALARCGHDALVNDVAVPTACSPSQSGGSRHRVRLAAFGVAHCDLSRIAVRYMKLSRRTLSPRILGTLAPPVAYR